MEASILWFPVDGIPSARKLDPSTCVRHSSIREKTLFTFTPEISLGEKIQKRGEVAPAIAVVFVGGAAVGGFSLGAAGSSSVGAVSGVSTLR